MLEVGQVEPVRAFYTWNRPLWSVVYYKFATHSWRQHYRHFKTGAYPCGIGNIEAIKINQHWAGHRFT